MEGGHTLKSEHEALRATLKRAMREPGRVGELARKLAQIADGHFLREEKFVMPLLGLLKGLAQGEPEALERGAPALANGLRGQLMQLGAEHRQMAELLRELSLAADAQGVNDYVSFAEDMIIHHSLEEEVLYPAAIVAGEFVKRARG